MNNIAKGLFKGAQEAVQYASGYKQGTRQHKIKVPQQVDVKGIRLRLHLIRSEFSERFGFSARTLEKWEQGSRSPDTAARAYLTVIAYNSKVVNQALNNAQNSVGLESKVSEHATQSSFGQVHQ